MSGIFTSQELWVSAWAFTGMILGSAGFFFWGGQVQTPAMAKTNRASVPPPLDQKQKDKYDTATFGMG